MNPIPSTIRIVTVAEMRALETAADRAGVSYAQMMETAGVAVADLVITTLGSGSVPKRVLVLVGPGNNGGDGLVAGRLIAARTNAEVAFVMSAPRDDDNLRKVKARGLTVIFSPDEASGGYRPLIDLAAKADVIVDALLGTGAALPLRGEILKISQQVNRIVAARTPKPYVIAIDLPTGMDADSGQLDSDAIHANETVTFEAAKPGHYAYPGALAVGELHVASLNLPPNLPENRVVRRNLIDADTVRHLLPIRPPDANKGTFGKALIVSGSANYIGAAALAAQSAYRVGAGLVSVATPAPNVPILATHLLEATWLHLPHENGAIDESTADVIWQQSASYTALLFGPGIGQAKSTLAAFEVLFADPASFSEKKQPDEIKLPPLVIDADGLNLLAKIERWWTRLPLRTILTPHAGEMARLAGIAPEGKQSAAAIVQSRRMALATEKAKLWNCIIVLKGAYTIIADPDGRGAVLPFANAALARAGTGDVLAGAIVGYLAQGLDPFDAAVTAGYVHGSAGVLAGERVGTTASVLASDVIACLPAAIRRLEMPDNSTLTLQPHLRDL